MSGGNRCCVTGMAMNDRATTKEPQYSLLFDVKEKHGIARLGLMVNEFLEPGPQAYAVHAFPLQIRRQDAGRPQACA